jgi:lipoprotein-releasing system ATP-binding protein
MAKIILELQNISKEYEQADHKIEILQKLSLSVAAGESIAIIGQSGSGKSTLLQIAGLIDKPSSGKVIINSRYFDNASDAVRSKCRGGRIGYIYQHHHLLPEFSAIENVMMPLLIMKGNYQKSYKKAKELIDMMGLESRINHMPSELSGGEQQRIAIARAFINNPTIILADEPTGNLDPVTADAIMDFFVDIVKIWKSAAIIVTHDHELAKRMDKTYNLSNGKLEQFG